MEKEVSVAIISAVVALICAIISSVQALRSTKAKNKTDILIQKMKQDHEKSMADRKSDEDKQNRYDKTKYTAITNYFEYAHKLLNNPYSEEAKLLFLGSVAKVLPFANETEKKELLKLDEMITELSTPIEYDAIQRIQYAATPLYEKLCKYWSDKLPLYDGENPKH